VPDNWLVALCGLGLVLILAGFLFVCISALIGDIRKYRRDEKIFNATEEVRRDFQDDPEVR
jgi:hypothetical protein